MVRRCASAGKGGEARALLKAVLLAPAAHLDGLDLQIGGHEGNQAQEDEGPPHFVFCFPLLTLSTFRSLLRHKARQIQARSHRAAAPSGVSGMLGALDLHLLAGGHTVVFRPAFVAHRTFAAFGARWARSRGLWPS